MEYLAADFKISCPGSLLQTARDLLADGVAEAGFESFEDTDAGLKGYAQKALFDEEALNAAIKDFPLENTSISYTISKAENKDWNETWEEGGFEPICINVPTTNGNGECPRCLTIAPYSCSTSKPWNKDSTIFIDARLAFGTGTHETTQMIVSTLLNMELKGKRVLDCGCGTGILGIVASKLGAKEVTGYDIDEWSVENTKHNANINNVGNITALLGDASVIATLKGKFDIVLANINRNILLHDMPAMASVIADGGTLILSGFYKEDIPLLDEEAKKLGFALKDKKSKGDWQCMIEQKQA